MEVVAFWARAKAGARRSSVSMDLISYFCVYVLLPDTETALYYLTRMGKTPGQDKRRINKSVKTIQFGCDMAMTQQTYLSS